MPTVMTRIVVWMIILGAPLTAQAQQDAGDDQGQQTAAEQFARGKELFAAGEYSEAAVAFTEAYDAAPHQAVLANIVGETTRKLTDMGVLDTLRRQLQGFGQRDLMLNEDAQQT